MEKKLGRKLWKLAVVMLFVLGLAATSFAQSCPSGAICRPETPGSKGTSGPYGYSTTSLPGYAAGATVYVPKTATAPFSAIVFMQPLGRFRGRTSIYQSDNPLQHIQPLSLLELPGAVRGTGVGAG